MDLSLHAAKFPADMSEYFRSSWRNQQLWLLDAPRRAISVRDLEWHLDHPFLSSDPPNPLFDVNPRQLLNDPRAFPRHWARVVAADLAYPIAVCGFGDRLVILDGIHRLLKAVVTGVDATECKLIPRQYLCTAADLRHRADE